MKSIKKHTIILFSLIVLSNLVQLGLVLVTKDDSTKAMEGITKAGYVISSTNPVGGGMIVVSITIYLMLYYFINKNSRKAAITYFIFMLISLFVFTLRFSSLDALQSQVENISNISKETVGYFQNIITATKVANAITIVILLISASYTFKLIKKFKKEKQVPVVA